VSGESKPSMEITQFVGRLTWHAVDRGRDLRRTLCGRKFYNSEDPDGLRINCRACLRSLSPADRDRYGWPPPESVA
jgi:hypothetical protein